MNITSVLASKAPKVVTVRAEQSIREALALLAEHDIGALVVVDGSLRPVGIVSERDVVREAARNEALFGLPVAGIMTREVILGVPGDDLGAVAHTMTQRRIRHLPIVDQGRLIGMVSMRDILKVERDQYRGEVDTLQLQLLEHPA